MAIKEFEIAVVKNPDKGEYLRGLGWAIFSSGNAIKGLDYLRRANEKEPQNVNTLNDLAVVYFGLLDFNNAKLCIKKALTLDPDNALAKATQKQIVYLQKKYKLDNCSY